MVDLERLERLYSFSPQWNYIFSTMERLYSLLQSFTLSVFAIERKQRVCVCMCVCVCVLQWFLCYVPVIQV